VDFVIELVLDLLWEGTVALSQSKTIPAWLRYILIGLIALFCTAVFAVIFLVGLLLLQKTILGGLALVGVGIVMAAMGIHKFRKLYLKRKIEP
jgi:hypothetical protein